MRRLLLASFATVLLGGCSLFFDPDVHLGVGDGGTDTGVDSAGDANGDTSTDAPPRDGAPDGPDARPDGAPGGPAFCMAPDTANRWIGSLVDASGRPNARIIDVAITGTDPPIANLGYVDSRDAQIQRIDLDAIETSGGRAVNLSEAILGIGQPAPFADAFAIQQGPTAEALAVLLIGRSMIPASTASGLFVGVVSSEDDLEGSTLFAESPPAADGLDPAVITGDATRLGRHMFRELRMVVATDTPTFGSMLVGSVTDNGVLTGPLVPTAASGVWGVGSDGYVALLGTATRDQMMLWTGLGSPQTLDFTFPDRPYESDVALLAGDDYVVSHPGPGALNHHPVACEIGCAGTDCALMNDCPSEPATDAGRDGTGRALVATDHVEGVGVATVLAEEMAGTWNVTLRFIDPALNPILDDTGGEVSVMLHSERFSDVFALDVDTIVRGDRITVLVAIGFDDTTTVPGESRPDAVLLSWDGILCP